MLLVLGMELWVPWMPLWEQVEYADGESCMPWNS